MINENSRDKSGFSGKPDNELTDCIKSCPEEQYRTLMITQMEIYKCHIGTHLIHHPDLDGKEKSLSHFFNMYGSFFRYIYCGFACENRAVCTVCNNKFFNVKRTFEFDELSSFPHDFSMGVMVENCFYSKELNAIQLFFAKSFLKWKKNKKELYLKNMHENNTKTNLRLFLKKYGHLIQEMFCSTVCSKKGSCKRGNTYIPKHYA